LGLGRLGLGLGRLGLGRLGLGRLGLGRLGLGRLGLGRLGLGRLGLGRLGRGRLPGEAQPFQEGFRVGAGPQDHGELVSPITADDVAGPGRAHQRLAQPA
jgi:hypothetical protein